MQIENWTERKEHIGKIVLSLVVLAIVFLRLKTFFHGSSLMIDESNLARNIAERGFLEFWQTLNYEQYAPPVFLSLVKLSTLIFGMNEYALRLPALLASLLGIYLLIRLCQHPKIGLNNYYIAVVLVLYGASYLMLIQSNMLKQYSCDAMLFLLYLLRVFNSSYKQFFSPEKLFLWTIAGCISIWFSMPIVFVLASIGIYYFFQAFKDGLERKLLVYFLVPTLIWVLNFLIYFFLLLKSDAESSYLQNYHDRYFLDISFSQKEAWLQNWSIVKGMIQSYVGASAIAIVWFLGCIVAGKAFLAKQNKGLFVLLLLPFGFAAFASFLNYYSFIPRLLLFTMPAIFIVSAIGLRYIWQISSPYIRPVILLSTLFVMLKMNAWIFMLPGKNCLMEETREVLDALEISADSEYKVFVNHEAAPALTFYTQYHDNKAKYEAFKDFRWINWDENLTLEVEKYLNEKPNSSLFSIWGHTVNEVIDAEVAVLKEKQFTSEQDIRKWRARGVQWQKD